MPDYWIAQGDSAAVITRTLSDESGPVNLTGASVQFIMFQRGATSAKVNAAATLTDAPNGGVSYALSASDTDTAGDWWGRFKVTYNNGKARTFPNDSYLSIQITPEVG